VSALPCPSCGGAGHFPADTQFPACPPPRNADGTWACNFCRGTGTVGDAARWTRRDGAA
jgi:hypothetical protein